MEPTTPLNPVPSQGPVVGIIIVLIVLAVGAFYFLSHFAMVQSPEPVATTSDMTMSTSDDPDAITSDLEAQNLSDIDAELNALDAELNQ